MRKLIIAVAIVAFGITGFSQQVNDYMEVRRAALKTEKKALIADVMELSKEESEPFWALYNEYQGKLYTVNTKYLKIVNDFSDNFETMTEEMAKDLMTRSFAYESEILKLKKNYNAKFLKILSARKTLMYFQTENKISDLIHYEVAQMIPLLDAGDVKKEPKKKK
ncbi:MAG: hypothetical protein GXO89_02505 [Chlorobi bacterium]|nr:hypothetical protein [Chlorobiota bacterium]